MAIPVTSQGDEETIGSKGIIKKTEFIRVITRALYSLGYDKTGAMLEAESGISLHNDVLKEFLQQVKDGKWDKSVETLHRMGLPAEKDVKSLLLEQKFFDFLKTEKIPDALGILRNEIQPLSTNTKRVHELASSLISPPSFISHTTSASDNESVNSRSKVLGELENFIPASVIVPEKRLEYLVENALHNQLDSCYLHNVLDSDMTDISLYSDHQCGKHQIPSQTVQILKSHTDEVWFLQFSHNGKYLASCSKDKTAIIWQINADGHISLKHILSGHQKPVTAIFWSPDDGQVITCAAEELIRRWDVKSGLCVFSYEKDGMTILSCGWCHDGQRIIAGMSDSSLWMWNLDGVEIDCLDGKETCMVSDIAVTDDGEWIISIASDSVICLYNRETKFMKYIQEEDTITSFSLSNDNKYILVDLFDHDISLWDIEGDPKVVARYQSHKRSRYVIRSCFGGYEQAFIASGSEDSQVYIWQRYSEELIHVLPGHSGAVNCVSWSPTNHHMLASGSDDGTIRIWGLTKP